MCTVVPLATLLPIWGSAWMTLPFWSIGPSIVCDAGLSPAAFTWSSASCWLSPSSRGTVVVPGPPQML